LYKKVGAVEILFILCKLVCILKFCLIFSIFFIFCKFIYTFNNSILSLSKFVYIIFNGHLDLTFDIKWKLDSKLEILFIEVKFR
jgi:hypothetical protein